jgi:hypothetical protein
MLVDVDTEMPVVALPVVLPVGSAWRELSPVPPDGLLPAYECAWPGSLTVDVDVAEWLCAGIWLVVRVTLAAPPVAFGA